MRLQTFLALLAPFALIALFHHMHFATVSTGQRGMRPAGGMTGVRRRLPVSAQELGKLPTLTELAGGGAADGAQNGAADKSLAAADLVPAVEPRQAVGAAATSSSDGGVAGGAVRASAAAVAAASARTHDVSIDYPPPTLSSKRLLDTSENWLPVPDAEGDDPSDLRWIKAIPAACKPRGSAPGEPFDPTPPDSASAAPFVGVKLPDGCICPPGRRP